jgi:hypothetical protein
VSPGLTAQRSKISQNASIHFASMRSASMPYLQLLQRRHARPRAGHPRLDSITAKKTWMAGTGPAMTEKYDIVRIAIRLPETRAANTTALPAAIR